MEKKNGFKYLSNKDIIDLTNRLRREKEHYARYGNYGTGRYVAGNEFYDSRSKKEIRQELQRRKEKGLIKPSAGQPRQKRVGWAFGSWNGGI